LVVYGTPAEETASGKLVMAKEGIFDDLDVAFMMHGSDSTTVDGKSLALNLVNIKFHGGFCQEDVDNCQRRSCDYRDADRFHYLFYVGDLEQEDLVFAFLKDAGASDVRNNRTCPHDSMGWHG